MFKLYIYMWTDVTASKPRKAINLNSNWTEDTRQAVRQVFLDLYSRHTDNLRFLDLKISPTDNLKIFKSFPRFLVVNIHQNKNGWDGGGGSRYIACSW